MDRLLDLVVAPDGGRVRLGELAPPAGGDADGAWAVREAEELSRSVGLPCEVVRTTEARTAGPLLTPSALPPRRGRFGWSVARRAVGVFALVVVVVVAAAGNLPWSTAVLAVVGLGVANGLTALLGLARGRWTCPLLVHPPGVVGGEHS